MAIIRRMYNSFLFTNSLANDDWVFYYERTFNNNTSGHLVLHTVIHELSEREWYPIREFRLSGCREVRKLLLGHSRRYQ